MTWFCQSCQKPNAHQSETCHTCGKHWTQVWQGRKKSRSQNRPKKDKKQTKDAKDKKSKEQEVGADEDWTLFSAKVPWIASTPHSRLQQPTEGQPTELPLPPAPVLPVPPSAPPSQQALSAEDMKLMNHLQGLRDLGVLPMELSQRLELLEQKHQESLNTKALSHAQLNKLHKVRNQTSQLAGRIRSVDEEWRKFLAMSMARLTQHSQMFQAHRQDLLSQYNQKVQELAAIKEEVSLASQSLIGQVPVVEPPAEPVNTARDLQQFQELAQSLHPEEALVVGSDEEEELQDADMEEAKATSASSKPTLAPRPFRTVTATSPTKVQQNQLKQSTKKATAADKVKETKEEAS
eukprot:Skav200179  [mRNA]  locus=scaffold1159:325378:326424:- [translate_table: standard]